MPNGSEIRTRPNGQRSDLHDARRGMDVHRGLSGDRRVTVQRPDRSRIVAERGGRGGYVQRPYTFRGHEFAHRTYYAHGRAYDRFYRPYNYRGMEMEVYAPARYYPANFYGWVYNPWLAPAPYAWGWAGSPWYGYYGTYFAPEPMYPNASLWLTDYMISNSLADGYQARIDAGQAPQPVVGQAPVSPEVKALISVEVQRQVALENAEAKTTAQNQEIEPRSSGIARMLADGVPHVFLVGQNLDLVDVGGRECMVSAGDVLQLGATPPDAANASLVVLASKGGQECAKSTNVSVTLNDLQDMQNYMRETIDQGLGEMHSKQGKGGLPAEPLSARAEMTIAPFAQVAPPPEPNCANEIAQQALEADRAESEVGGAPISGPGPSDQTAANSNAIEISVGMSVDQVTALIGSPKAVANVGVRKMFVYSDRKITFTAGKVTAVQ